MTRTDYGGRTLGGNSTSCLWDRTPGVTMQSVTSLPADIGDLDDVRPRKKRSRPVRKPPRVVTRPSAPAVVRTFADGEQKLRTWSRLRRVAFRVPAGLVHAADLGADATLCGAPLSSLQEFGRSRHPFERITREDRCPACDSAAGHPQA